MSFGKRKRYQNSNEHEDSILSDNVDLESNNSAREEEKEQADEPKLHSISAPRSKHGKQDKQSIKPLLNEVTMLNSAPGKNPRGAKAWHCNHCKINFTSTYTRIHTHFFGSEAGKKADIQRCKALMNNRDAYVKLKKKVEEVEGAGVSARLRQSTIIKKQLPIPNISPLEMSFGTMAREAVDLKIMRCLCANAIAFNCLRSPQWHEMVQAISQAPKGYKSPSFEKARTSLLDECYMNVEKELAPVKDTWYIHGVSVVSDVEKIGQVIADFLLDAIEKIGPSNVLQVVTDNAKNFIAAGREVYEVKEIVRITKPIYMLLKFCDGEGPRMGEIYERMDNMLGEIKDIMATSKYKHDFSSMEQILITRWDKMKIPLHYLGFSLTPRFYDHIYLETSAPGGFIRRAPNLDKEVVMGCMEAFSKIAENADEEK